MMPSFSTSRDKSRSTQACDRHLYWKDHSKWLSKQRNAYQNDCEKSPTSGFPSLCCAPNRSSQECSFHNGALRKDWHVPWWLAWCWFMFVAATWLPWMFAFRQASLVSSCIAGWFVQQIDQFDQNNWTNQPINRPINQSRKIGKKCVMSQKSPVICCRMNMKELAMHHRSIFFWGKIHKYVIHMIIIVRSHILGEVAAIHVLCVMIWLLFHTQRRQDGRRSIGTRTSHDHSLIGGFCNGQNGEDLSEPRQQKLPSPTSSWRWKHHHQFDSDWPQ